ncbi:hypothetical protein [Streptomyces sp. NPDC001507]|uniref:hypothetical protein n=1 Tax=Streptomyces sp. NPDC001507 TaxID=3364579 RepID=UPI0036CF1C5B
MRVVPAAGETTWSFVHRVAAAYRLQVTDLAEWWRWPIPVRRENRERPDGEVLLDTTAQQQLAGGAGCRQRIWPGRCRRGRPARKH